MDSVNPLSTRSSSSYVGNNYQLQSKYGMAGIYQNQGNIAHLQPSLEYMKQQDIIKNNEKKSKKSKNSKKKSKIFGILKYFDKNHGKSSNETTAGGTGGTGNVNHYKYNSNEPQKGTICEPELKPTHANTTTTTNDTTNTNTAEKHVYNNYHRSNLTDTVRKLYAHSKKLNSKPHTIVPIDFEDMQNNNNTTTTNNNSIQESSVDAVRSTYLADNSIDHLELIPIPMCRQRHIYNKDHNNIRISHSNKSSTLLKPKINTNSDGTIRIDIQNPNESKYKFHFISKKKSDLLRKNKIK